MSGNVKSDVFHRLVDIVNSIPAVDAHTHIQDDLTDFTAELTRQNIAGTQAGMNRPSDSILQEGLRRGRLVRRTMMDATHALFYSWFAEIVEGANNRLDEAMRLIGANSDQERKNAGLFLLRELHDSRFSEYAEWIRFMFRQYNGVSDGIDPLDPAHFDAVWDAVAAQRHDPGLSGRILAANNVTAYVTSIENRNKVPSVPPIHPSQVDLEFCTHPEAWSMFDFNGLLWPERATDFGLFTQGHKFEAEKYLLHLEEYLEAPIGSVRQLKDSVHGFFFRILRSPRTNPKSRILYVDGFQAEGFRFSRPYSSATVDHAIRHYKAQLEGDLRQQVVACVAEAMLETLEDIGREYKQAGERFGCCIQLCGGATHFMDWAREIQSIPAPIPRLAQDEYPVWSKFPNVHFEYISAHEALYSDLAAAAKQVGNVSAGPWWHFFHRHQIARMLRDQLSQGPVGSIACGFTDARFVEMLAAKYRSLRLAVVDALASLVEDEYSALHGDFDAAREVASDILLVNPCAVHHIPLADKSGAGS
jgi:hypothetical protein